MTSRVGEGFELGIRGGDSEDAVETEALARLVVLEDYEVANLASLVRLPQERDLVVKLGVDGSGDDFGVVGGLIHDLPFCTITLCGGYLMGWG